MRTQRRDKQKEREGAMLNFNSEHFLWRDSGYAPTRRLLVGIDAPLTAATRHALDTAGEFFAPYSVHVGFLLLTVIPVPYGGGRYTPPVPLPPTSAQRKQAMKALQLASASLQEHGITRSHIETLIRVGSPAEELVSVVSQQRIDCLIVGSRGHAFGQRLRRVFMGSTSQCVLRQASCPVLVVTEPRSAHPRDLVAWYEAAIRQALSDSPSALINITASDVVDQFLPPHRQTAGRKERMAAVQALEHLACSGILYRHIVKGEMHYHND